MDLIEVNSQNMLSYPGTYPQKAHNFLFEYKRTRIESLQEIHE